MYTCGLTVYDYAHIGNFKSFLTSDILHRLLLHHGYEVRLVKNITDVGHLTRDEVSQGDTGEDKLEIKARAEHKSPEEIAQFYEAYLQEAEEKMNILRPAYAPRATAHISHMIRLIETLLSKGHAYESNGNVFYDISSFSPYGELSGNTLEHLKIGARLEAEHPDKKNQWDFALWLKASENHIMQWDSPWGRGYPGWHIECSAMSMEYLGDRFDIHTGGEDHIFPHHEAEIAQTEGATDKHPSVRFWIHTRHMMIDGKKMSKSKGNCYRLEDIQEQGYSPMHLRLALLSGHYRSQMNFTWNALAQAKRNYEKIAQWASSIEHSKLKIENHKENPSSPARRGEDGKVKAIIQRFWDAMDDDLNTPEALSALYELMTVTKSPKSAGDNNLLHKEWQKINSVLGLTLPSRAKEKLPEEVLALISERDIARATKDFARSDSLRAKIEALGYAVEDTQEGTKVKNLMRSI